MRLLAPRQSQSYLFWLPRTVALAKVAAEKMTPGKGTAVRRSCFLPHSTDIHLPSPRSLASIASNRQPDKRV